MSVGGFGELPDEVLQPLVQKSNNLAAKKAKVDFQGTLHEVQQLASLSPSDFTSKLSYAKDLIHQVFSVFEEKENLASDTNLTALTSILAKVKEVSKADSQVFKEIQLLENALKIHVPEKAAAIASEPSIPSASSPIAPLTIEHYALSSLQLQQMTPQAFWAHIAEILRTLPREG